MSWIEIDINNYDEYEKYIRSITEEYSMRKAFLYRGQSKHWPLLPSFTRIIKQRNLNRKEAINIEKEAKKLFTTTSHIYLKESHIDLVQTKDILAVWSYMQHHKAPTRILDWTWSPYVAAYFAVAESWDANGEIWIFNPNIVNAESMKNNKTNNITDSKFYEREEPEKEKPPGIFNFSLKAMSTRMASQQSAFTVCQDILGDHELCIENILGQDKVKIYCSKLIIHADAKPKILRRLQAMNITAASLFPDADGLGKSVSEMIRLQRKEEVQCYSVAMDSSPFEVLLGDRTGYVETIDNDNIKSEQK